MKRKERKPIGTPHVPKLLRIPKPLFLELKAAATRDRRSVQAQIIHAIEKLLRRAA
jgi:hypothetical protein